MLGRYLISGAVKSNCPINSATSQDVRKVPELKSCEVQIVQLIPRLPNMLARYLNSGAVKSKLSSGLLLTSRGWIITTKSWHLRIGKSRQILGFSRIQKWAKLTIFPELCEIAAIYRVQKCALFLMFGGYKCEIPWIPAYKNVLMCGLDPKFPNQTGFYQRNKNALNNNMAFKPFSFYSFIPPMISAVIPFSGIYVQVHLCVQGRRKTI